MRCVSTLTNCAQPIKRWNANACGEVAVLNRRRAAISSSAKPRSPAILRARSNNAITCFVRSSGRPIDTAFDLQFALVVNRP